MELAPCKSEYMVTNIFLILLANPGSGLDFIQQYCQPANCSYNRFCYALDGLVAQGYIDNTEGFTLTAKGRLEAAGRKRESMLDGVLVTAP